MDFTITNNDTHPMRVNFRFNNKFYDAHVPNEDAMQATFEDVEILPNQSYTFENVDVLSIVKLGV